MIVGLLICLSLAAVALAIAVYRSLHRYDDVPDFVPTSTSGTWEPFYGCSNNAPWYMAQVERERLLDEWWDYLGAESQRRGGAFPFPIMEPGLHAPEPYVAPIGIEIDPDPCTKMSRWTGVGGYPQDSICKCRSCRSKLVDHRVHGWDRIERPTSVIESY